MKLIDGKEIAAAIQEEIATKITTISGRKPGLAFVSVGNDPASRSYVRMKKKACAHVGILSFDKDFPAEVSEAELLKTIIELNNSPAVDGILIQLPLPAHLSALRVMETISPAKDVDGFHPLNLGKLLLGETDGFFPCTPYGIATMLEHAKIPVSGKHVVIVGRSNIVGKPLAALLMQKSFGYNATVTVAHSFTKNLPEITRSADILIAAMGSPHFIKKPMVKPHTVVIDVGINRISPSQIVGDVDFDQVAPITSAITPVPGGVGPMTIAMLLSNTLLSFARRETKGETQNANRKLQN